MRLCCTTSAASMDEGRGHMGKKGPVGNGNPVAIAREIQPLAGKG